MSTDLLIELVTEHNHVFKFSRQYSLLGTAVIPDPGFAQEVKARALDQLGFPAQRVCTEEDGGAEDPLQGGYQPTILCASFLEPEGLQHLGPAAKAHGGTFLLHGECG